jgi:hypothetical protein
LCTLKQIDHVPTRFVAGLCNVSRTTVRDWINGGRLEAKRDLNDHDWLISMISFKKFLVKNDRYRRIADDVFQENPEKWVAMARKGVKKRGRHPY